MKQVWVNTFQQKSPTAPRPAASLLRVVYTRLETWQHQDLHPEPLHPQTAAGPGKALKTQADVTWRAFSPPKCCAQFGFFSWCLLALLASLFLISFKNLEKQKIKSSFLAEQGRSAPKWHLTLLICFVHEVPSLLFHCFFSTICTLSVCVCVCFIDERLMPGVKSGR